ncbi:PASTA domain-containing protein [bacterium]|jgi:hypothetical protein|nr:PASTA domain-containing protein [bacterium]
MLKRIKKIIFFLWPPYEAYLAGLAIDHHVGEPDEAIKSIDENFKKAFSKSIKIPDEMEDLAKLIFESENKRRDIIESKALSFISSFSVAISIALTLPILLSERWNFPAPLFWMLGIIYILGVVYLVASVYWSVMVRRVEGVAVPNVDDYIDMIKRHKWGINDRIIIYMRQAKINEIVLTKKANSLSVAESMFIRGLVIISMATIVSGISSYFVESKQDLGCVVPNTINLDSSAAEKMLLELGLQPIISNEYSSNVNSGLIISQSPVAGSLIKPCGNDILLVISLGATPTLTPTSIPVITPSPTQISQPKLSTPTP